MAATAPHAATNHVMPTYARVDLAFERGEGAWLIGTDGRRYLDFTAGVAVNVLGHAHPHLVEAVKAQAEKMFHVSNLFRIPEAERLAERLCAASFADVVFFANSGAEALEGTIKTIRKYQSANGHPERYRIITFEGAFHGRTLATLAAGGQKKHLDGFGPVVDGFDHVEIADFGEKSAEHHGEMLSLTAVKRAVTSETAGILIEPIMGEGGVRVVPPAFLRGLRKLCDEAGILLAFDEVQTGMGRTGALFSHEKSGVTPDVMALAKALGGGFPIGAVLATAEAAKGMTAGTHGSTFGGNPLAVAVANAVFDIVAEPSFLQRVQHVTILMRQRLAELADRHPSVIGEIRGEGLLIGLKAVPPNGDLVDAARAEGLLTVAAGDNVVRLLPPLIIGAEEIDAAFEKLDRACTTLARKAA